MSAVAGLGREGSRWRPDQAQLAGGARRSSGRRTRPDSAAVQRRLAAALARGPVVAGSLVAGATLVAAHDPSASAPDHGLGFGAVVALTVVLGVLGGVVVVKRRVGTARRLSIRWIALLLVGLGCWAAVLAVRQGSGLGAAGVAAGALGAWTLRNRVAGGHHVCDEVALGAVLAHRLVEGALLAAVYAADAAVGVGAALLLAAHAAAETGAVAGLWSVETTGRWRWAVVGVVQAGFVAGALGGEAVARLLTPPVLVAVLALLGGALIATGVATSASRRHRQATATL